MCSRELRYHTQKESQHQKTKKLFSSSIIWFNSSRVFENIEKIQNLLRKLFEFLNDPTEWISLRSKIEDLFKFGKKALSWESLHCYTKKSVQKTVTLNALLLGLLLLTDSDIKKRIKQAAEW